MKRTLDSIIINIFMCLLMLAGLVMLGITAYNNDCLDMVTAFIIAPVIGVMLYLLVRNIKFLVYHVRNK